MEELKMNESGFWFHLMQLNYKEGNLPEDTCGFRRKLIISALTAILLFPLTILRMLWRLFLIVIPFFKREWDWEPVTGLNGYWWAFIFVLLPTIAGGAYYDGILMEQSFWKVWLVGAGWIGGGGSIFLILIGIGALMADKINSWRNSYIDAKNLKRIEVGNPPEGKISVLYNSWKDKYCKRIKWVNEDNDNGTDYGDSF